MIIRREQRTRFTIVDNASIEDPRLTFKALGLLAYLLSKPDGWTANYRQLASVRKDGETSVQNGLKELKNAGYLEQRRFRNPDGSFGWECIIHEQPCGGFPSTDDPGVEKPRNSKELEAKNPPTPQSEGGGGEDECKERWQIPTLLSEQLTIPTATEMVAVEVMRTSTSKIGSPIAFARTVRENLKEDQDFLRRLDWINEVVLSKGIEIPATIVGPYLTDGRNAQSIAPYLAGV